LISNFFVQAEFCLVSGLKHFTNCVKTVCCNSWSSCGYLPLYSSYQKSLDSVCTLF